MTRMVEVGNALAAGLDRPLNWIHMPVAAAAGESFVAPLHELRLHAQTDGRGSAAAGRTSARRGASVST